MRKSKILTSLALIACVIFLLGTIAVYADSQPTTITTITTTSGNNTVENEVENKVENKVENETKDNTTTNNSANPITIGGSTNNSANRLGASSTNNSATTSKDDLPYTGSNYSIVFVIVALGISAVYAYRKVTEYNV